MLGIGQCRRRPFHPLSIDQSLSRWKRGCVPVTVTAWLESGNNFLAQEIKRAYNDNVHSGHSRLVHVCIHRREGRPSGSPLQSRRAYMDEAHDGAKHVHVDLARVMYVESCFLEALEP